MKRAADDYYAVLGVAPTASQKEISRAFRTLMRTRHPDVGTAAAAPTSSEVLAIMRAFSVLKDPRKRAEYDRAEYDHAGRNTGKAAASAAQDVPVRQVPDIPLRRNPDPQPLFRITPVRWEQGPWIGAVKQRRTR